MVEQGIPPLAIGNGALVLDEPVTGMTLAGGGLIVAAVALTVTRTR